MSRATSKIIKISVVLMAIPVVAGCSASGLYAQLLMTGSNTLVAELAAALANFISASLFGTTTTV